MVEVSCNREPGGRSRVNQPVAAAVSRGHGVRRGHGPRHLHDPKQGVDRARCSVCPYRPAGRLVAARYPMARKRGNWGTCRRHRHVRTRLDWRWRRQADGSDGSLAGLRGSHGLSPLALPWWLVGQDWAVRLHHADEGIPYGIALAGAALWIYPSSKWFAALGI